MTSKAVFVCENCAGNKAATIWCENCEACLCTICSDSLHKPGILSKHKRIPVTDRPATSSRCPRHKSEYIKFWCESDENLLCPDCFTLEHVGHAIKSINESSKAVTDEIEKDILNVQTKLNDHLDCANPHASNTKHVKKIVTETFTKLRNMLNNKEKQLIEQIDAVERQNTHKYDEHQTLLKNIRSSLEKISKELEVMSMPRNPVEIMKNHQELRKRVKKIGDDVTNVDMPLLLKVESSEFPKLENQLFELLSTAIVKTASVGTTTTRIATVQTSVLPEISLDATWSENAETIITGLDRAWGLAVDQDDGTVYVADCWNCRIVSWNPIRKETNAIVSDIGYPTDVFVDKETNSIIIADRRNKRVLRHHLENRNSQVEVMIDNIGCIGLAMDNEGSLFVCDYDRNEVRKFPRGEKTGIVVAGGNGLGSGNHQLNCPRYIALDDEGTLYVTDYKNHRVMKWTKEAKEGITVAGGNGQGSNKNQLNYPHGIVVDSNGNIFIADEGNDRVTRWRKGEKTGEILVGGNGRGNEMNQFNTPVGLSFDRQNNLYVADYHNKRVQLFAVK